jgi:hypothetical protein
MVFLLCAIDTTVPYLSELELTGGDKVHVMATNVADPADHWRLEPSACSKFTRVLKLPSATYCMHH